MNWSPWVRRIHRWLSAAFALAFVANLVALMQKQQIMWLWMTALAPLFLLLVSGTYLLILPYVAGGRSVRTTQGAGR